MVVNPAAPAPAAPDTGPAPAIVTLPGKAPVLGRTWWGRCVIRMKIGALQLKYVVQFTCEMIRHGAGEHFLVWTRSSASPRGRRGPRRWTPGTPGWRSRTARRRTGSPPGSAAWSWSRTGWRRPGRAEQWEQQYSIQTSAADDPSVSQSVSQSQRRLILALSHLRHYAKRALTPRQVDVKLGPGRNYHNQ